MLYCNKNVLVIFKPTVNTFMVIKQLKYYVTVFTCFYHAWEVTT